jgi:hypothetical protein
MTDYPPGAIIRNRGRLWRVDDVQGEVLTATSLDGAQADQGRFYIPVEKIQPGRITPPQATHIDSYQSQDLLLAAVRLALIHGAAPLVSLQRSRVIPKDYQMVPVVMALRQPRVLEAEYQQFARHYTGRGGATPTIRLEARSSDLLTVTMLYPKV